MNANTQISIEDLKEQITFQVNQAQDREIPLFEAQSVFRNALKGNSGRNYDGLKARVLSENTESLLLDLYSKLGDLLKSHTYFDDKFLTFYLNNSLTTTINQRLASHFTTLTTQPSNSYQPYQIIPLDTNVIMYQFGVVREINVRQQLNISDLSASIAAQYHNVYGVKRIPLLCFDFIIVDLNKNTIIKGIDLAKVLGKNELNVALNNFNIYLRNLFNSVPIQQSLEFPLDLFPKIQSFYDEPKDKTNGVIDITFTTPAGTAHNETLRGKGIDLRVTTYHQKGVEGVKNEKHNGVLLNNDINPYKIGKRYYRKDRDIDIYLESSYQAIHSQNGSHLYQASVYSCRSYSDLNFAIQKIIT